jgi:hypothetical protein
MQQNQFIIYRDGTQLVRLAGEKKLTCGRQVSGYHDGGSEENLPLHHDGTWRNSLVDEDGKIWFWRSFVRTSNEG